MKRIFAALLALATLFSLLTLTSCKKNDGVPDGMQLVRGGADVGYNFWGPENWIISNYGNISCTYVSSADKSSITFTEAEMPEVSVAEYFESEAEKFAYGITVNPDANGVDCNFGNAIKPAKKYVYTYDYNHYSAGVNEKVSYTCMQIFIVHEGRFYIFTYTAANTPRRGGDTSYYDYHLERVQKVIDEFRFIEKSSSTSAQEYEKDADGYMLISDKVLSGFKLYVPANYTVNFSSGTVVASAEDGANVAMSTLSYSAGNTEDYWYVKKESIKLIADKIVDDNGEEISSFKAMTHLNDKGEPTEVFEVTVGNAKIARAFEYTYSLDGVEYHVYQVLMRKGGMLDKNVYTLTFTATGASYESHLAELQNILNKIEL